MIIDWLTEQTQRMLSTYDAGLDETGAHFDFALSEDIMSLLYAQNETYFCTERKSLPELEEPERQPIAMKNSVTAPAEQEKINAVLELDLDEYELALA